MIGEDVDLDLLFLFPKKYARISGGIERKGKLSKVSNGGERRGKRAAQGRRRGGVFIAPPKICPLDAVRGG